MTFLLLAATLATTPIDCNQVRQYVAEYGRAKALAWAIKEGYSWRQIKIAQSCLLRKD